MTSIPEAKTFYEDLSRHCNFVGAYSFTSHREEQRLRFDERQTRIAQECAIVDMPDDVRPTAAHGRILIIAPSPWHALIHLLVENRMWLSGVYDGRGRRMALYYRGQSNTQWNLLPSIDRPGIDADFETEAVGVFASIIERFYRIQSFTNIARTPSLDAFSDASTPFHLHVATAQHYGLATKLMDFTTDPAVAIWFACQSSADSTQKESVVFAIPSKMAEFSGINIFLPHLYVTRLYRQRGIFLQSPLRDTGWLRRLCVEIRFPADPSFQVLRQGEPVRLLPDDDWWLKLTNSARRIAKEHKAAGFLAATDHEAQGLLEDLFLPEFLMYESRQRLIEENLADLVQMLLSITTTFDTDFPEILNDVVDAIVCNNATSLRAILPLLREYVESLPRKSPLYRASAAMIESFSCAIGK